jgi:hypothetical protein
MCFSSRIAIIAVIAFMASVTAFGGPNPPDPPRLDRTRHAVALDSIVFDTFGRGPPVPLAVASDELIATLRNAIRPVYAPRYESSSDAGWLEDEDAVLGYVSASGAYAYPVKFLNYHEIVNDTIDGVPIAATYCPLCASAMVFDRRASGRTLVFGNTSALHENDMVMFDHETGSYWFQAAGTAIVGPLTGTRLRLLASMTMSWGEWRRQHPATQILARDQGFGSTPPYERDPFAAYPDLVALERFPFPVSQSTDKTSLSPAEIVVSTRIGDTERAYPLGALGDAATNDRIANVPVVVFSTASGPWGTVFARDIDGRTLEFDHVDGHFRDRATGSVWNLSGAAVRGPLEGHRLRLLPTRRAFWFALRRAVPNIEVYTPTR